MIDKKKNDQKTGGGNHQVEQIISNCFFTIYGIKRKTPNEFTKLADILHKFRDEIFKVLYIPQIVEYLNNRIK